MSERLSDRVREYLSTAIGRDVQLRDIRTFLKIEPGSRDDTNLRVLLSVNLVKAKVVKPSGKGDGSYRVMTPIIPVEFSLNGDDKDHASRIRDYAIKNGMKIEKEKFAIL